MINLVNKDIVKILIKILIKKFKDNPNLKEDIEKIVANIYIENGSPDIESYEMAEKNKSDIVKLLKKHIEECRTKRTTPRFELYNNTLIKGFSNISLQNEVLEYIRKMNDFLFEKFCVKLLQEFGIGDLKVTGKTRDGGIDFIGELNVLDINRGSNTMFFDWNIKIIGQAKRYRNTVGRPDIQKFIGVATDKKREENTFIPIQFVFFTTGSFSSEAKRDAQNNKIIIKDGEQIVEMLIERNIGTENGNFNDKKFNEWLK